MDFLQGIPVEYKLETYNMPRTGPTSCQSKRNSALDTLAHISLLVHINGDNADSPPKIPDTKLHGDSKHNPSHVPQHTLPAQHPAKSFRLQH